MLTPVSERARQRRLPPASAQPELNQGSLSPMLYFLVRATAQWAPKTLQPTDHRHRTVCAERTPRPLISPSLAILTTERPRQCRISARGENKRSYVSGRCLSRHGSPLNHLAGRPAGSARPAPPPIWSATHSAAGFDEIRKTRITLALYVPDLRLVPLASVSRAFARLNDAGRWTTAVLPPTATSPRRPVCAHSEPRRAAGAAHPLTPAAMDI
ncbi:hypothetical protein HYPSUDRAFT_208089 [Hypholoma sublateritium FD-334 SS-4]|uniref:Uncharacterized protein n=1 Tax=Hypholoma sublateritium (strain FD-334 SS-4) TaxID=945553 RepID=A0A0D2NET2_HYPSF|nr:hypothetical protein HYPSUDRAFT_208089 [Hypholoma sublateritium FD-334 SS-4]